jgi:hypothetical protein
MVKVNLFRDGERSRAIALVALRAHNIMTARVNEQETCGASTCGKSRVPICVRTAIIITEEYHGARTRG